jgi:hypothetical protein
MSEGGYDWEPLNSPSSFSSLKKSTHYGCSVDDANARARAITWSRRSLNANRQAPGGTGGSSGRLQLAPNLAVRVFSGMHIDVHIAVCNSLGLIVG